MFVYKFWKVIAVIVYIIILFIQSIAYSIV